MNIAVQISHEPDEGQYQVFVISNDGVQYTKDFPYEQGFGHIARKKAHEHADKLAKANNTIVEKLCR